MKDIYQKYLKRGANAAHYLKASKIITVLWGIFAIGAALLMSETIQSARQTTIVLINAVGSMLYGPILAAFLIGMLGKKVSGPAIRRGIGGGIGANVILWLTTDVSWMWWNVSGFLMTGLVAVLSTLSGGAVKQADRKLLVTKTEIRWRRVYGWALVYFLIIMLISLWLEG